MDKQVKTVIEEEKLTAYIFGDIDHHSAKAIREVLDTELRRGSFSEFIIDMGGVTFTDSSGLGLVMGRYRLCESAGIKFSVISVPSRVMQMFNMAGLERIIEIKER